MNKDGILSGAFLVSQKDLEPLASTYRFILEGSALEGLPPEGPRFLVTQVLDTDIFLKVEPRSYGWSDSAEKHFMVSAIHYHTDGTVSRVEGWFPHEQDDNNTKTEFGPFWVWSGVDLLDIRVYKISTVI